MGSDRLPMARSVEELGIFERHSLGAARRYVDGSSMISYSLPGPVMLRTTEVYTKDFANIIVWVLVPQHLKRARLPMVLRRLADDLEHASPGFE
jgi:hypothetical protein